MQYDDFQSTKNSHFIKWFLVQLFHIHGWCALVDRTSLLRFIWDEIKFWRSFNSLSNSPYWSFSGIALLTTTTHHSTSHHITITSKHITPQHIASHHYNITSHHFTTHNIISQAITWLTHRRRDINLIWYVTVLPSTHCPLFYLPTLA